MPIYEYQCSKCGHLEVFQRITENPLTRCPTCQRKVTKLISQSSFHLKGSGWYMTDYARKSSSDTNKPGSDAKGADDTSKSKEGGTASGGAESGDRSSSPAKDSGASSTKDGGSASPASGKLSGAGSAAV